ncbi:MAG: L,D-transpeptidase [Eubacteriales bacterium]|nr:L,D-transpeptidase [Eubacteriales bacterium]
MCALLILALVLGVAGLAYMFIYANTRFLPLTYIDKVYVGGLTAEEADATLTECYRHLDNAFTIERKDGLKETLLLDEAGVKRHYEGITEAIKSQDAFDLIRKRDEEKTFDLPYNITIDDEGRIIDILENSIVNQEGNYTVPGNAYSEINKYTGLYEIKKGVTGTQIRPSVAAYEVTRAVKEGGHELKLSESSYVEPEVKLNNKDLAYYTDRMNALNEIHIKINMGGNPHEIVEITNEELRKMVDPDFWTTDAPEKAVDKSKVERYVRTLAGRYNTANPVGYRFFTSITGKKELINTTLGWTLDEPATLSRLYPVVEAAVFKTLRNEELSDKEKKPVLEAIWTQTCNSHGENDFGPTYIEVSIAEQKLRYVENGEIKLESDVVTGLQRAKDRRTPTGVFTTKSKRLDKDLTGYNPDGTISYVSHVQYWMPFNGNIGFHDASWRWKFGGTIYKWDGSHGCINMPIPKAKELYSYIQKGMTVIVYAGTEPETDSAKKSS